MSKRTPKNRVKTKNDRSHGEMTYNDAVGYRKVYGEMIYDQVVGRKVSPKMDGESFNK
jgi:hypothetical protein